MKQSLRTKLDQLSARLAELDALLAAEDATRDIDRYRTLSRERAEIDPVVVRFGEFGKAEADLATAVELAHDPQMRDYAEQERRAAESRLGALEGELQAMLLPKDPSDERNVFVEIRAGTGGEESALFAAALFRMYARYAERRRWTVEIVSESPSDLGGYREIIARIAGAGAYAKLKFESGGHRVQRVPETEAQGRIHTSACTVAVLPEADPVADITINPADLRIDTFRASGAGGQHVNKTDSAVRITHLPTGIVVQCQNERSQHANKDTALRALKSRLLEREEEARQAELLRERGILSDNAFGSQIRSYVLHPYTMVNDHRSGLKNGNAQGVLDGDLDPFISAFLLGSAAGTLGASDDGDDDLGEPA